MFQHDCLESCCLECLICMSFVFLYLHLFSATEHVSHERRSRNTLIIIIIITIIIIISSSSINSNKPPHLTCYRFTVTDKHGSPCFP